MSQQNSSQSGITSGPPDNPDPDPNNASVGIKTMGNLDTLTNNKTAAPNTTANTNTGAKKLVTLNTPINGTKKVATPKVEIIGDTLKSVILDPSDPRYGKINRVCILDVDRNFTIEAVHGHALKPATNGSTASGSSSGSEPPLNVEGSASTSSLASSQSGLPPEDRLETEGGIAIYPHDADVVLKNMDPNIHVEIVYLRPDVRQSIAAIRRRKHVVDVFINLYDRADETGQKIVDYMQNQGLAFTGAGSRFYDPTRMELKRLCRYSKIPTPAFAIVVDSSTAKDLAAELGGFPLFVKPEHGYDSVGIDEKSMIFNQDDLSARVAKIVDEFGSALVERYVDGREFSVLVAGAKGKTHVFPPVEYRFPKDRQPTNGGALMVDTVSLTASTDSESSLDSPLSPGSSASPPPTMGGPAYITFEDKWGANFENRWFLLDPSTEQELISSLEDVALKLYEAFEGEGYARFDIRRDSSTGQLMVLDVNPNASLFYKDECTVDSILRMVGWGKERFMTFLIDHALDRQRKFHMKHSYQVKYSEEHGFSLHASRALQPGDLVYSDEECPLRLITREYAQRNWSEKELSNFDAYAWPLGENVFAIWDQESSKWKPINHSCDPNTWMDGLQVIARRPIANGEELTLDYATFEPTHPAFECWCGAACCRKMVRPNEFKEQWFQERYGSHVSPYILMLIGREALEREKERALEVRKLNEAAGAMTAVSTQ